MMVKRTMLFISLSLLIFGIWSCSKEKGVEVDLQVSTDQVSLANQGETKAFHVKSNVNWSATASAPWLSVTPSSGGNGTTKLDVVGTKNNETTDRQATITVTAGAVSREITVMQRASNLFSVSEEAYAIGREAQELTFEVQSNTEYAIEFDSDWMYRKSDPVLTGTTYRETLTIQANSTLFERSGTVTLRQGGETLTITIDQGRISIHIAPDATGVASDAVTLGAKMRVGWNLGNALEAAASPTSASETMWGNPKTNKAMIDAVKAAGFNAVRIPCAWSGYIENQETHLIRESWLARVKEVVDYCVDNDMYAIINMHWDGGWLEEHPLYTHQVAVGAKQKALWEQIAVYFRDYDEHLLFAGTNEVRANYNTPTAEHIAVQQFYNQNFVDAVRSTGGRNAYRNLIVQSYNTNIRYAIDYMDMPADVRAGRLMAEVHFYDPYEFSLDHSSGKYLSGASFAGSQHVASWGQEDWVDQQFSDVKRHFVDRGIPVILGEYSPVYRGNLTNGTALANHKKARADYLRYVTRSAKANGLVPFYWDNGHTGDNGSGLFDRASTRVVHQDALDAIMEGAN